MRNLLLILILMLTGCKKDPINTNVTNNPNVNVSLLFEHDGIKVYRFYDNGNAIYYTDARGKTFWKQSQGENGSFKRGVETVDSN